MLFPPPQVIFGLLLLSIAVVSSGILDTILLEKTKMEFNLQLGS